MFLSYQQAHPCSLIQDLWVKYLFYNFLVSTIYYNFSSLFAKLPAENLLNYEVDSVIIATYHLTFPLFHQKLE